MNNIVVDFITEAYEEISRNDLDVQQEFADITRVVGIVIANWCK